MKKFNSLMVKFQFLHLKVLGSSSLACKKKISLTCKTKSLLGWMAPHGVFWFP